MTETNDPDPTRHTTMFDRWQEEQQRWQQLIVEYVDKAATDEGFLTNLGNAMRGSLLANKPYPGAGSGAEAGGAELERAELDELVFAMRRMEGQILDLTLMVERLVSIVSAPQAATPSAGHTAPSEE